MMTFISFSSRESTRSLIHFAVANHKTFQNACLPQFPPPPFAISLKMLINTDKLTVFGEKYSPFSGKFGGKSGTVVAIYRMA
jgi:hypothetical protein